jgi:hypothetical protein
MDRHWYAAHTDESAGWPTKPNRFVDRSPGTPPGELLVSPRFALTGNVIARYANSGELDWERPDFVVYQGVSDSRLGKRNADFSGLSAQLGVRAYIGY